jgi:hypothetical protein
LNRSAKNKEFKDKKIQYQSNTGHLTHLTKELLLVNSWTQQAVINRSESLAKEAVDLWNWSALGKELKVTVALPKEPRRRTVKKAAKKRTVKKAAKKRTVKKAAKKRTVKKAAKKRTVKKRTS